MTKIDLSQLPPEILAMLESYKSGTLGTRSPIRQQLKDLRTPETSKGRLHRPSFGFSAEADPEAPPYAHQAWPKLLFNERGQEIVVNDEEMLAQQVANGFSETPFIAKSVALVDAVRADLDALSDEDRAFLANWQREQRIKRIQASLGDLTEAETAQLSGSVPDAKKRGPGRPKAQV